MEDPYHTMGELYEHRNALFAALMKCNKEISWISRCHNDGSFESGWFLGGIDFPDGAITYHMPICFFEAFQSIGVHVLDRGRPFDGHSSQDVIDRLFDWAHS